MFDNVVPRQLGEIVQMDKLHSLSSIEVVTLWDEFHNKTEGKRLETCGSSLAPEAYATFKVCGFLNPI